MLHSLKKLHIIITLQYENYVDTKYFSTRIL